MSRYRKIEVRTWSDEKFRALSGIPASGQGLWFFLLAGPHTGPIPGLFRAGRAGMAEELGWDTEAFDEAFVEVSAQGMAKADFKAKLVWLPNALRHNKPESPNVVRSWRVELDLLPECALKREAISSMREYLSGVGGAYVVAFDELFAVKDANAFPKAAPKASSKASVNQEQEQEQEMKEVASLPFVLPEWIPKEAWIGYVEMRKQKRAPMTKRARELKIAELLKFKDAGHDVGAILDKSTTNAWTDVYEPKGVASATQPVANLGKFL